MKRLTLLIFAAFAASGCGRTESNEQQARAMEQFDEAWKLQSQAVSGAVFEDAKLRTDAEGNLEYAATIEDYRLEKQEAAAQVAQSISGGKLSGGQRAAAKLLVAQSQESKARKGATEAMLLWSQYDDLRTRLLSAASSIALQSTLAEGYARITFSEQLAAAQAHIDEATRERSRIAAEVQKLEDQLAEHNAQLAKLTDSAREKAAEADALNRMAFVAKGRAQYDLYVRSAQATNEADDFIATADNVRVRIDLTQSALTHEKLRLEGADSRLESLNAALASLRQRSAETKELADAAAKSTEKLINADNGFLATFEKLTGGYVSDVVTGFEAAAESMQQAIDNAQAAASSADGGARGDLELHVLALRTELGAILRQKYLAERGYRDLLGSLLASVEGRRPQLANAIEQAIGSSDERLAATQKRAEESLAAAQEQLAPMTQGNGEAIRIPLTYLKHTYTSLASVTGNQEHAARAQQIQQRIGSLGQSNEQPQQPEPPVQPEEPEQPAESPAQTEP